MPQYPVEHVPDEHKLYLRVHQNNLKPRGELHAGIFREHNSGMSTDWSKYATPKETRQRAVSSPAELNGVVSLRVGGVRALEGLTVQHDPLPTNRAHTEVHGGAELVKARVMLLRICREEIPVPWPPGP